MPKPRMLDLFCGANLPNNESCGIIVAWSYLNVRTATRTSRPPDVTPSGVLINVAIGRRQRDQSNAFASIAARDSGRRGGIGSSVLVPARTDLSGRQSIPGPVSNVALRLHCDPPQTPIGAIVPTLAKRRLSRRRPRHGGRHTRRPTQFTKAGMWQRILLSGGTRAGESGLRSYAYWGVGA